MSDPFPIGLDDPDDLEVASFKPKHRQLEPPKRWGRPVRALLHREYDSVPAAGHQLVKGLRGLCMPTKNISKLLRTMAMRVVRTKGRLCES